VVCILEVMKMMNSIQAGLSGDIVEVCVEDAQVVEEGEPLFRVEAAT
jgi:acetyl-CoA carboxylase biotin carboxyl carrier protein